LQVGNKKGNMKKNLFNFNLSNSSETSGSQWGQETCEPCSSECEKIKRKIDNRKLSDLKDEDVTDVISPFKI
jgi:hypothetical protein